MSISGRLATQSRKFNRWSLAHFSTSLRTSSRDYCNPEVSGHSSRASTITWIALSLGTLRIFSKHCEGSLSPGCCEPCWCAEYKGCCVKRWIGYWTERGRKRGKHEHPIFPCPWNRKSRSYVLPSVGDEFDILDNCRASNISNPGLDECCRVTYVTTLLPAHDEIQIQLWYRRRKEARERTFPRIHCALSNSEMYCFRWTAS
jgi:hypothetical protein